MPDSAATKDRPRYCAYCGADVAAHGHDDDCRRPEATQRGPWTGIDAAGPR